jgi:hypothetical protein
MKRELRQFIKHQMEECNYLLDLDHGAWIAARGRKCAGDNGRTSLWQQQAAVFF